MPTRPHVLPSSRFVRVAAAGLALAAATVFVPGAAQAQIDAASPFRFAIFHDQLAPVADNPPAHGQAVLIRQGDTVQVVLVAFGLSPSVPHAIHIHGVIQAANECPTIQADTNGDGLVDTVEGLPAYGPIQTTFTTTGGTSGAFGPDSLDLGRAPMANAAGVLIYRRTLPVKDTVGPGEIGIPRAIADNLADFHIVMHGADLNGNGRYDFGPGTSSLSGIVGQPVPLEAELPVACGRIQS